jgi:hypothetical protein
MNNKKKTKKTKKPNVQSLDNAQKQKGGKSKTLA